MTELESPMIDDHLLLLFTDDNLIIMNYNSMHLLSWFTDQVTLTYIYLLFTILIKCFSRHKSVFITLMWWILTYFNCFMRHLTHQII